MEHLPAKSFNEAISDDFFVTDKADCLSVDDRFFWKPRSTIPFEWLIKLGRRITLFLFFSSSRRGIINVAIGGRGIRDTNEVTILIVIIVVFRNSTIVGVAAGIITSVFLDFLFLLLELTRVSSLALHLVAEYVLPVRTLLL